MQESLVAQVAPVKTKQIPLTRADYYLQMREAIVQVTIRAIIAVEMALRLSGSETVISNLLVPIEHKSQRRISKRKPSSPARYG